MTQTSAGPSFPSTGIRDTDSIQFLIASVMCGTTYRERQQSLWEIGFFAVMHHIWYQMKVNSPEQFFQDNHLSVPSPEQTGNPPKKEKKKLSKHIHSWTDDRHRSMWDTIIYMYMFIYKNLIYLSSGNIVVPCQCHIQKAFIISQI